MITVGSYFFHSSLTDEDVNERLKYMVDYRNLESEEYGCFFSLPLYSSPPHSYYRNKAGYDETWSSRPHSVVFSIPYVFSFQHISSPFSSSPFHINNVVCSVEKKLAAYKERSPLNVVSTTIRLCLSKL